MFSIITFQFSRDQVGVLQFNPISTNYLELASDLAIWGFNPKRLPPLKMLTAFYRLPDVKN